MGPPWVEIDEENPSVVTITLEHGRAHPPINLPELTLHLGPHAPAPVVCEWEATSTGLNGVQRGVIELPAAEELISLEALIPPSTGIASSGTTQTSWQPD